MAKKGLGSAKRFGARYGATVKHKLARVEEGLKKFQKCPYCGSVKAKRVAAGIWKCRKCEAKFTGRAYSLSPRPRVRLEVTE